MNINEKKRSWDWDSGTVNARTHTQTFYRHVKHGPAWVLTLCVCVCVAERVRYNRCSFSLFSCLCFCWTVELPWGWVWGLLCVYRLIPCDNTEGCVCVWGGVHQITMGPTVVLIQDDVSSVSDSDSTRSTVVKSNTPYFTQRLCFDARSSECPHVLIHSCCRSVL